MAKRKFSDNFWDEARTAYITSRKSVAELARELGVSSDALSKRVQRGGWQADRLAFSSKITREATERIGEARVSQLAKFNEQDLLLAQALRARVAQKIRSSDAEGAVPLSVSELRSLALAAESAQRIGRLALGATTQNEGQAAPDDPPIVNAPVQDLNDLPEEERHAVLDDYLGKFG